MNGNCNMREPKFMEGHVDQISVVVEIVVCLKYVVQEGEKGKHSDSEELCR